MNKNLTQVISNDSDENEKNNLNGSENMPKNSTVVVVANDHMPNNDDFEKSNNSNDRQKITATRLNENNQRIPFVMEVILDLKTIQLWDREKYFKRNNLAAMWHLRVLFLLGRDEGRGTRDKKIYNTLSSRMGLVSENIFLHPTRYNSIK